MATTAEGTALEQSDSSSSSRVGQAAKKLPANDESCTTTAAATAASGSTASASSASSSGGVTAAELARRRKIEAKMFKNQKRHYKKDTRYVLDLYTLTFDEDETVDSIGTIICKPETSFNLLAGCSGGTGSGGGYGGNAHRAISSHYFSGRGPLTKSKSQPSFDFFPSMTSCSSSSTFSSMTSSANMTSQLQPERSATPTPSSSGLTVSSISGGDHNDNLLPINSSNNEQDQMRLACIPDGPTSLPVQSTDFTTSARSSSLSKQSAPLSTQSLARLETNLHKILARKFADEMSKTNQMEANGKQGDSSASAEQVSFKKAKLLTKAYYRLLRNSEKSAGSFTSPSSTADAVTDDQYTSLQPHSAAVHQAKARTRSQAQVVGRQGPGSNFGQKDPDLTGRWQALVNADTCELKKMVEGLSETSQTLNEYLVHSLIERDELLAEQAYMLEEISELADTLLTA